MRKLFGVFVALIATVSVGRGQESAPALITILTAPAMTTPPEFATSAVHGSAKMRHDRSDNLRSIVLDGVLNARLGADRFFTVTVLSGEHDLRSENVASFSFQIAPGEHAYIALAKTRAGDPSGRNKDTFVKLSCNDLAIYLEESHPKPASEYDFYSGMIVVEKAFPRNCDSLLRRQDFVAHERAFETR